MRRALWLLVTLVAVAATNISVYFVTYYNAQHGIYPVDADSISIPIFESLFLSLAFLFLLVPAVLLMGRGRWLSILAIVLAGLAAILSVSESWYWLVPNHYIIALLYAVLAASCIVVASISARSLASNNALERTRDR